MRVGCRVRIPCTACTKHLTLCKQLRMDFKANYDLILGINWRICCCCHIPVSHLSLTHQIAWFIAAFYRSLVFSTVFVNGRASATPTAIQQSSHHPISAVRLQQLHKQILASHTFSHGSVYALLQKQAYKTISGSQLCASKSARDLQATLLQPFSEWGILTPVKVATPLLHKL